MQQLIYTSAPKLLEAGKTGFGTLARSKEMPQPLVAFLERISAFDRQAGVASLQCYTTHRMGRVIFHVLSRISDCGADYTGRTNHLAHHFVIEEGTPEAMTVMRNCSPAAFMLALSSMWQTSYSGGPGYLDDVQAPFAAAAPARVWAELTGRPDAMRWLSVPRYQDGCCLLIDNVATENTCLQLIDEALGSRPNRGWGIGFSTASVGNISVNLTPFICLDARQAASGVKAHPGYPALEVSPKLGAPPAPQVAPAAAPVTPTPLPGAPAPGMPAAPVFAPAQGQPTMPQPPLHPAPFETPPPHPLRRNAKRDSRQSLVTVVIVAAIALGGLALYQFSNSSTTKAKETPPPKQEPGKPSGGPKEKEVTPKQPTETQNPPESPVSEPTEIKQPSPTPEPQTKPDPTPQQQKDQAKPTDPPAQDPQLPEPTREPQPEPQPQEPAHQVGGISDFANEDVKPEPNRPSKPEDEPPPPAPQEDAIPMQVGKVIPLPLSNCEATLTWNTKSSEGPTFTVKLAAKVNVDQFRECIRDDGNKIFYIHNEDNEWISDFTFRKKSYTVRADQATVNCFNKRNEAKTALDEATQSVKQQATAILGELKKKTKPADKTKTASEQKGNEVEQQLKQLETLEQIDNIPQLKELIEKLHPKKGSKNKNTPLPNLDDLCAAVNAYQEKSEQYNKASQNFKQAKAANEAAVEEAAVKGVHLLIKVQRIEPGGNIIYLNYDLDSK